MSGLAYLDTETTGLDPDVHQIWEVGLIIDDQEYVWQLPVDLGRADARALDIGHFHERRQPPARDSGRAIEAIKGRQGYGAVPAMAVSQFAHRFAELTWGRHLVGAVVSFDEERLRRLLRANGACPGWHYHLIDVEALAVGWLYRQPVGGAGRLQLPWDSRDISRAAGVDPDEFDQHTALGDARWAKALYEACCGDGDR